MTTPNRYEKFLRRCTPMLWQSKTFFMTQIIRKQKPYDNTMRPAFFIDLNVWSYLFFGFDTYREVEKKTPIADCDISKSYCPNAQIFIGEVENIPKFFSENFGGRNFEPRRYFWKKPTNGIFKKCQNRSFEVKKSVFGQNTCTMHPIR